MPNALAYDIANTEEIVELDKSIITVDRSFMQIVTSVKTQDSSLSQVLSSLLKNLHLSLPHQDPSHLTWQVHGHQNNITALIIKLSHPTPTWTPLAVSVDCSSYNTA